MEQEFEVLETRFCLCPGCMQEHEIKKIRCLDHGMIFETDVEFPAIYWYCDRSEELYAPEDLILENDRNLKDAYRLKKGLLTSKEIAAICKKCGLSERDLSILLDFNEDAISRYETYEIQSVKHDQLLRLLKENL